MSTASAILITGAGKRIGATIAAHLAAQGHDLVLHYRHSAAEATALAETLRADFFVTVTLCQGDLTDPHTLTHFWEGLPPVRAIIHNASLYERDRLETTRYEQLRAHMAINFEAPLYLTQGFMAQLPDMVSGSIIIIGDGTKAGSMSPNFFSYSASKAAWDGAIDLLASACAPRARANVLALAPTLMGANDAPGVFDRLSSRAPLKRVGKPEDVLHGIDFLLGNPAVTGQTINLANGMDLRYARPDIFAPLA